MLDLNNNYNFQANVEIIKGSLSRIKFESEECYESWVKESYATRKKFGLSVSYDIVWQRQSSSNNYASLSGHGFLSGVHTRCVIICVVFSKKCSVCEIEEIKFQ